MMRRSTGTRRAPSLNEALRVGARLLILAALLADIAFLVRVIDQRGLFEYVALDYRGSRTAGEAILEGGLAAAYDPGSLEGSQRQLYDRFVRQAPGRTLPFDVVPAPYPPPFTLVFVPSAALQPVAGFVAWTLLHAAVLLLYPIRLARAFGLPKPGWLIAAIAVSMPALIHLVMGQISVWLMVFLGEAAIALRRDRDARSGAWCGLMVLKPQSLVLIVPALAWARRWRMLAGMAALLAVLVGSTVLMDPAWPAAYLSNVVPFFGASGQEMTAFPSSMTNWRAFGLNATRAAPAVLVWPVVLIGMAVTAAAGLMCARFLGSRDQLAAGLAWLGLAAATNAASWHAHVHQSLILVPPLFMIVGARPSLRVPVEAALAGTSLVFVGAVALSSVGAAHDLIAMVTFACLLAVTAACAVRLHGPGQRQITGCDR